MSKRNISILIISLSIIFYFIQDEKFESSISMYPSYEEDLNGSSLLDLANQFGVGRQMNTNDPVIYVPDIVSSFILKEEILFHDYESLNGDNLFNYWKSKKLLVNFIEYKENEIIDEFADELDKRIKVDVGRTSGLITITTYFENDYLSKEVINFIHSYLIQFINESSKEKAETKILYLNKRQKEVKNELNDKEEILKKFLMENNDFDSPLLQTEYLRIIREVELANQVYSLLVQQVESEKLLLEKEELNFVVSDRYDNPKPIKISIIEIIIIDLILIIFFIFILPKRGKLYDFFSPESN